MYKDQRIVIVVPAYNESHHIAEVIKGMPDFVDHIIVVDDASKDDTYEVALGCADQRLRVLKSAQNQGVGGATICGYRQALELDSAIIVKMDGDGRCLLTTCRRCSTP